MKFVSTRIRHFKKPTPQLSLMSFSQPIANGAHHLQMVGLAGRQNQGCEDAQAVN
jgi:hypothetical protein